MKNKAGVLQNTTGVLENKACLLSEKSRLSLAPHALIAQGLRAYRSRAVCLLLVTSLLIAHLKFYFHEFAATLPHIAQNAFVQGI